MGDSSAAWGGRSGSRQAQAGEQGPKPGGASPGAPGTPGKRTLTESLPVQRESGPMPTSPMQAEHRPALPRLQLQDVPGNAAAQRTADDAGRPNPDFVNDNANRIIIAIMDRIAATPLSQPHLRLRWKREGQAKDALGLAISHYIQAAPGLALKRMMMLSYPADLFALIDDARRGPAGSRFEAVKLAVATAFDEPVMASIVRMGTRACVQLDLSGDRPVLASALVASCPLDGVLAELLVDTQLVDHRASKHGAPDDTGGRPFARGARTIRYEWQGARDPGLWNWIKVSAPADATVEDVAQHAFVGDHVLGGSEQAYRIAASPPFFGIPFETARLVEQARAHAPDRVKAKLDTGPGPRIADPAALERSAISDEAALAQAPAPTRGAPPADQVLDRVQLQLAFLHQQLAPWHAAGPLGSAGAFVERRRAELGRDPQAAQRWAAALGAQDRVLHAAASEAQEVLDQVTAAGARPQDTEGGLGPVTQVLTGYARAAGVSHLHAEAPAGLADARRLRTMLPITLAEDRVRGARGAVADQRAAETGAETLEPNAARTPQDVNSQMQRAADLRLAAARGEPLAPEAVEQLNVDAGETELRARLVTLATQAHSVLGKADEVGLDKARSPSGAWSVHMISELILQKVNGGWHEQLDAAARFSGPHHGQSGDQALIARRRDAIKHVSHDLMTFAATLGIGTWLKDAYDQIKDQQLRNLIWNMALQIGITLATGQLLGAAGAALRGLSLAGEIGAELRGASLLYQGTELAAQAGANTAIQGALGGPAGARELAENALGSVLTHAALRPFQGLLHDAAAVEGQIQTWGRSAGRLGKAAAELVIDTGASIGAAGVAHAATHGGHLDQADAEAWVTMGLSIAASKFVQQRTQGMQHRIAEAARQRKTRSFDLLLEKVAALAQRSMLANDRRPTPEQAIELLTERHRLLALERTLYEAHPEATQALTEAKADLAATGARFAEVPFQLAHLRPVVDGHIYEGTAAEIEQAFHAADATGVPLTREWLPERGGWRITASERVIELHERGARRRGEAESRGAHEVPNSSFTGQAPAGQQRRTIELEEVEHHARSAVTILDGLTKKYFAYAHDGAIMVSAGPEWCRIGFEVVEAMSDVARHTYKHGANKAWIEVSEHARPEDLARAIAHELSEIVVLMESRARSASDPAALTRGSKATDLSHHDVGRKAELQVLLYELESQPARREDILKEISALVDHLGFDMATIGKNCRARSVFGEDVVQRIGQAVARKRLWVTREELDIHDRFPKGATVWKFSIDAPLPNGESHNMAFGDCPVDAAGQPVSGPQYALSKRVTFNGEEVRVTIGDGKTSISLTDLAIKEGNRLFEARFGHAPTELRGTLIEDNRTIFQKAYLAELDAKVAPDLAAKNAIKKTPFGIARVRAEYDQIEVLPFKDMRKIVYGDPPTMREVPYTIEAIARKK
jgi:hypothetical protein